MRFLPASFVCGSTAGIELVTISPTCQSQPDSIVGGFLGVVVRAL
jgi:hypothetical protein